MDLGSAYGGPLGAPELSGNEQTPVTGDPAPIEPPPGLAVRLPLPVAPPGGTETDLGATCCITTPLGGNTDAVGILDKARGLDNLPEFALSLLSNS